MGFSALRLYHFRNLQDAAYRFASREVFFIGENGQGKTNCLEALYLLCYGSSFRTRHDQHLIRKGEEEASVQGQYLSTDGSSRDITVILKGRGSKEIRQNDKRLADRKDILLSIPCVVFAHDDLEFIIGAPARKRRFYNQTLCLYDLSYLELLRNYRRILFQRNLCLKQKRLEMLGVYNQQLAEWGFAIQEKRVTLMGLFNEIFRRYFRLIAKLPGDIEIAYRPSWKDCRTREDCIAFLKNKEGEDEVQRTTTAGPHRDQFLYLYDGADFCHIASTGQIRLLSIVLRVAQARFFTEQTGQKPVLLLDDVLLELDAGRRELLVKHLPDYEQAFFTFLPDEEYSRYQRAATTCYHVSGGIIQPWKEPEIF